MIFLFFLLFPFTSFSRVIQDDVTVVEKFSYNMKEVCSKMVTHESPLVEVVSGTELDCMGKKIQVSDFCDKELVTDPYYLRGYVNREKKEVVCVTGKKVVFKYQCTKLSDGELCDGNSKTGCAFAQKKLARRLDLVEHSLAKSEKGIKELSCKFESLPLGNRKL
jgi:hypothetical protein